MTYKQAQRKHRDIWRGYFYPSAGMIAQTHTPLAKTDGSQSEAQPSSFSRKMAIPENPKEAME